jgi:E3 ubiquitin-protein ligase listerin
MVDVLGLSGGKSFDAKKSAVTSFDPDTSTNPRQELEGLLTHLYYLSLANTSLSAKNWWIESNRLTVKTVESWTAKYISPHIISAALSSVRDWSEQQAEIDTAEGAPLVIKVSPHTSEITASYPMDEERSISIIVYLPPAFPLHQATVSSRSERSAIDERRWQGWLRSAQGVIAFSNNNIVDGLLAWRRNIVGALQGRSECTICYSLVSEDGKLPTRKCKTCKNAFHTICLTKWFASSGNKHCPLCRSDFSGR